MRQGVYKLAGAAAYSLNPSNCLQNLQRSITLQLVARTNYPRELTMHNYPGLGLPLRHYEQDDCEHYPIGAHSQNYGAESVPLLVRELAMMDVMEKITDKQDWHTKVFDADIVSKWQKEALAVPDEELYRLATAGKTSRHVEIDGVEQLVLEDDRNVGLDHMPKGILNEQAFESVSTYIRLVAISTTNLRLTVRSRTTQ
jgi:hypothetical protein